MIYRTVKDRDHRYVKLNLCAINDERLSLKAVGIHAYIMAKPDGWEARETEIVQRHSDGLASVRSGVKELIQYGYMVRVRIVDGHGRVTGWRIDTFETADLNPHYQADEKQPEHVDEPDCENHNLDTTGEVHPDCGFPDVENPDVENRNGSNNIDIAITDSSNNSDTNVSVGADAPPASLDSPLSLSAQFRNFRDELRQEKANRSAILRRAYVYCYGEEGAPDYGRIGSFARRVGGAGMALELLWSTISRPPNGDVLAYLEAGFMARKKDRGKQRYKPRQEQTTPEERRNYMPEQYADIIVGGQHDGNSKQ